jgi:flagellar M-ring protein FliF
MIEQARRWLEQRSLGQRIALGTLVLFAVLATAYTAWLANDEEMVPAFNDLKPEASSSIIEYLEKQKIPYEFSNEGKTLNVPGEFVHKVRANVVGTKVVEGNQGFSYFKEQQFGITDFRSRILYRKAMEEELEQTLRAFDGVENAQVHIVLPKKATFREDDQEASASVALEFKEKLGQQQVDAVINVVAFAVEGLEPGRITVVDTRGKLLSGATDPEIAAVSKARAHRASMEKEAQDRVLAMLEPILGPNNARAQVSLTMDFRKVQKKVRDVNPEARSIVGEERQETTRRGATQEAEGAPGVDANLRAPAGGDPNAVANQETVTESHVTTNYEVSSTESIIEEQMGRVTKMSVAVVINTKPSTDGSGTPTPRSEAEIQKLESIIGTALGINAERGDALVVSEMPFIQDPLLVMDEPAPEPTLSPEIWRGVRYGASLLIAILLLVFLVRPLIKAVSASGADEVVAEEEGTINMLPGMALADGVELGADGLPLQSLDAPTPRSMAVEFATEEPRKTAQILRAWLLEEGEDEELANPLKAAEGSRPREAARA